ncbi:MAG: FAD/NAD(P)-binding protein [Pseudomonadota bacterium]
MDKTEGSAGIYAASQNKTHIIVGDGITALAFLENTAPADLDEIIIIGKRASQLGRGAAYAKGEPGTPWRFAYLLNSPADDIDVHFAQWLAGRWQTIATTMENRSPNWLAAAAPLVEAGDIYGVNAPREFYGDFMEEKALARIAKFKTHNVQVNLIDAEAVSLEVLADGVALKTAGGETYAARSADIAPGGPSTLRIEGDYGPFSVPQLFGNEQRIVDYVKTGGEVFCIGGNASMLDVLRLCQSVLPESEIKFYACAPDGEIPAPLVPRLPRKFSIPSLSSGHTHAETFLEEVRGEIDLALANGDEMREIRAGFRAHFLEVPLGHYIEDSAEALKVASHLRFWLRGGTRDTIFDMRRLAKSGQVQVVKGFVTSIQSRTDGADVVVTDENGKARTYETGFVVNCAGAGPNSRFDPLTENLLGQGLIERAAAGGGLKVGDRCQTGAPHVRYLSPAVTVIGAETTAMPLYDAHMLRTYVERAKAV